MKRLNVIVNHKRECIMILMTLAGVQMISLCAMLLAGKLLNSFGIVHSVPSRNLYFIFGIFTQRNFAVLNISLLAAAKNRLNLINKEIEHRNCSFEKFKELLNVHSKFCDVTDLLNQCVSVNLMFSVINFVFHCTMQMFSLYILTSNDSSLESKIYCITACIYFPSEFFFMMSIIINSSLLKMEAKRTLTLVHSKNSFSTGNPEILKLLHLAALKIEHNMPMISCGLFIVDWKFLFATISGSLSSVIILIQFDRAENN